uniref:Uncharacterized protein n=1 Tax=Vitis vinifera TaxID=29760 RepID=A5BKS8_VITVI|nr:hypothetical protein VITISV_038129 [Vitis vinifera]
MDMCGAILHPCGSKYISGGMPKLKVLWLGNLLMIDGATSRERCIDHFAASKARTKCVGHRAALEEKLEA